MIESSLNKKEDSEMPTTATDCWTAKGLGPNLAGMVCRADGREKQPFVRLDIFIGRTRFVTTRIVFREKLMHCISQPECLPTCNPMRDRCASSKHPMVNVQFFVITDLDVWIGDDFPIAALQNLLTSKVGSLPWRPLLGDGATSPAVARPAYWRDFEGRPVIAMIVINRRNAAVHARIFLRRPQQTFPDGLADSGVCFLLTIPIALAQTMDVPVEAPVVVATKTIHLRHRRHLQERTAGIALGVVTRAQFLEAVPDIGAQFGEGEAPIQFDNQHAELRAGLTPTHGAVIEIVDMDSELLSKLLALSRCRLLEVGFEVHVTAVWVDRGLIIDQKGLSHKLFWSFINLFHARTVEP